MAQTPYALRFDGSTGYVTFGVAPELGVTQFTLELWFYREGLGRTATTGIGGVVAVPLFTKGRAEAEGSILDTNFFLGIRGTDSVLCADYEEGTDQTQPGANHPVFGTTPLARNTWYHAAATFDGTTWRLYLNGVAEAQAVVGPNRLPCWDSIQAAALASALNSFGTPSGYFQGLLDEPRLWNHARSQQEIAEDMGSELTSGQGLLARWGLNEGSGITAWNSVPGAQAGELVSNVTWVTPGAPLTSVGPHCGPNSAWRRGPAITVTHPIAYWPVDSTLVRMRPGDVIGIATMAVDFDYLLQSCTDCYANTVTKKWGPYPDRILYNWELQAGSAGELVTTGRRDGNAVLYQIPKCWRFDGQIQTATIALVISNDSLDTKALDPPITGTTVTFTMQACASQSGFLEVHAQVVNGSPQDDEVVDEGGYGYCTPVPPTWIAGAPLQTSPIVMTEARDLCPDYLALLSVSPTDTDDVQLGCASMDLSCNPRTTTISTGDSYEYEWVTVPVRGDFPLGIDMGPVVLFNRSRSDSAHVRALVSDSKAQFIDPWWVVSERTLLKAKKPKAFVGIGDVNSVFGIRSLDFENAAAEAKRKFEAQGYEVEFNASATRVDVLSAFRTPCYQAFWLTGHGTSGGMYAHGDRLAKDFVVTTDLDSAALSEWGCHRHPFLREVTLLGCNTYSQFWQLNLVCGTANTFNRKLWSDVFGLGLMRWFATDPYIWERDEHAPPRAHDLTSQ